MHVQILQPASRPARVRILLLPGVQQRPEDFLQAGFGERLQQYRADAELMLCLPELAHVADRSWLAPLLQLLRSPRIGVQTWLGGISLGAYMALRAAAEPVAIDGLCLLAPYLGSRILANELTAAGGLDRWQPGSVAASDDDRHVWVYARTLGHSASPVFLGLSEADRFSDTQRLLAAALPAGCVSRVGGGHDWPAWRQLWDNFLQRHVDGPRPERTQAQL